MNGTSALRKEVQDPSLTEDVVRKSYLCIRGGLSPDMKPEDLPVSKTMKNLFVH